MISTAAVTGICSRSYLAMTGRSRRDAESAKHDVAMEMADVICMVMLMARAEGIDLNAAIAEKWLKWEEIALKERTGPTVGVSASDDVMAKEAESI
jgi:hypothetical protein